MAEPVTPLDEARREAKAALAELPPHAEDTRITSLVRCARALRALLAVLPSPARALPTTVEDDAVTAWARLAVALLSRHESAWDHDPGPDDDGCDEDCRACEYVGLLRTGRAALSTPAPAPSTKEDTIEHPCGCYAPDGDVCRTHAAPSAPAMRRCEIKP